MARRHLEQRVPRVAQQPLAVAVVLLRDAHHGLDAAALGDALLERAQLLPGLPALRDDGPAAGGEGGRGARRGEHGEQLRHRHGLALGVALDVRGLGVGSYPIVTFQYSSATLYQVSDHIWSMFFESDNRK